MPEAPFQHRLRVRYHETDQQGIVYHARYLEYLDVAMTEYFRHLGWDYRELLAQGCDPSIVRTTLHFVRPASFEEEISICVRPLRVGDRSFTLGFDVSSCQDRESLLTAETVYVNFDPPSKRSRLLPQDIRDRLREDVVASAPGTSCPPCQEAPPPE